jgi:hypothetical protein
MQERKHQPFIFDDKNLRHTIALPAKGQDTCYDSLLPGLALRVSAKGTKTWIVQRSLNGKPRRFTLGRFASNRMSKAAREAARRIIEMIDAGKDPEHEAVRERQEARRLVDEQRLSDVLTFSVVRRA